MQTQKSTRIARKLLSLFLTLGMIISMLPMSVWAEDTSESTWTEVQLAAITADDTIAITMSKDGTTWVLPSATTNSAPAADTATLTNGKLTVDPDSYGWTITAVDGGYNITNSEGKYLYTTNTNNGVRVGTTQGVWSLDDATGYLMSTPSNASAPRYLGVYNSQDWRAYLNTTGNTAGQTLSFWKLSTEPVDPDTVATPTATPAAGEVDEGTVVTFSCATAGAVISYSTDGGTTWTEGTTYTVNEAVTLTVKATLNGVDSELATFAYTVKVPVALSTIAEALAGEANATFKVQGVVTLVDGKNFYVQDATGGICLRFSTAPSDVSLGDTVTFTGTRGTYNGLPQLNGQEYEKSDELTLEAADTTIGALTTADICTYVHLTGLTVTEVYDNNGQYNNPNITVKDANDNTIQIYKAVIGKTDGAWDVIVGDVIEFTGAVGVNNTTLQLRNTVVDEIEISSAAVRPPVASVASGIVAAGTVVTFSTETEGAVISYSTDGGETWTEGDTYTVTETVTIQVKATLDGVDSAIVTFTYTVQTAAPTMLDKLTEAPADGSQVIIHYPAGNMALTATASGKKLAGTAAAPAEDRLELTDDMAYMTVHVADDVYTFELDGTYLTSAPTGNGLSFAAEESDYSKWTLQQQDDGTWVIVNVNAVYNSKQQAMEYYDGFTTYSINTTAAYKFDFYGLTAKYGLVTDLSQLTNGSYVVIYNPGNTLAMTSETYRDWYLMPGEATLADGQVAEPAANQVWKVTVNADGTYTFTQNDYAVAAWLDGTYVEVTNNPSYNDATDATWHLDECNAETSTFYMRSGALTVSDYEGVYLEVYGKKVNGVSGTLVFCGYATNASNLNEKAYGMQFYLVPEPEASAGDLVTSLDQLTDGATVAIYSPGHQTAISTRPNGDWYLRANEATIENGKVVNFTEDFVWTVRKNADGTYSFYANGDETRSITVWKSDTYAELSLNVATYPDNTWTLTPAKTANCYYFSSPTVSGDKGSAYVEAYLRNEWEVFSGYFTSTSSYNFTESNFALQFYLVNPDDAIEAYDDGEWDGVLQKGGKYVAYNAAANSAIGLFAAANYSMRAIPTTIQGSYAVPGNGAYEFTVDTMGRYYTFEVNGKFFATNESEELFFADPGDDGSAPENAKWMLVAKNGKYIIYNKDAYYNGTPVCVEYYSSVFSGWTFSTKNDVNIYLFEFYPVAEGTEVRDGVVQVPSVVFDCDDSRYVEQDYACAFSLDDLAESISSITITYTAGGRTGTVTDYTASSDGKVYSFTLPADVIDGGEVLPSFTINVAVTNSYDISYTGEKTVTIIDEPFFTDLTPAPNSQTRDDKRPVISAKVGNVGDNPAFTMTVNGQTVHPVFENGVLTYTPTADMADGRVTVVVTATRADGVSAEKTWTFTVGNAAYQLYFGQLHSHTTYSDGSGSLDTALEYIDALPESANVQFVAFTDHSNYFDTTSAANPAASLNDKSQMTDASRALWEEYKGKVASFNSSHENLIALGGFEMTWSGGPGHINTFDSDGLVSRNNADLNNKTGDAGMKLYYQTINGGDSISQFNHPGTTFGNFTDFSYWDEATDEHMFLVEVGNGEGAIGAGGYYPSYEQYIIALDKGWHVAPTNNQDNHKGRWGNANDARDVILTNDFSEQGLYDAIRALRVYATEDKNLQINYTVNDEPMGTIFTDANAPATLDVTVTLYDPDTADSIVKVELVTNAGVTAYTWDNADELASGMLTAQLDPANSYYFVRVTQADGDLAVTAPVWVGSAAKLGIDSFAPAAEQVYVNEETTLNVTLFNNEAAAATVKSLIYTINDSEVIGTDTNTYTIPAGGTVTATFAHTFTTAKLTTVKVTAIVELDGKEYTYTANVELDLLDREHADDVTPIAQVRAASDPADTGYRFVIEGVVTSNASGYDRDTAFFDCIYVQDETGGICCFPVSGEYKIGDKVHIVGHTDFYQGEPELQVKSIEVIGTGAVEPTAITAADLNDRSAEGMLVTVTGTVDSFELANGLIQTIMVKDANGDLARVFIDGYITINNEVEGCQVGAQISATGLASYDDTFNAPEGPFPRIRIRDRADVVCTAPAEGFHITVDDKTAGNATVTGIDAETLYSGEVTFTVTCEQPCLAAVVTGENTYTVLTCTTENGEHKFTVNVTADVTVVIAVKGDANLDGTRDAKDATFAAQAMAGNRTPTALQQLVMDGDGNGEFDAKDATFAAQVEAGKKDYQW